MNPIFKIAERSYRDLAFIRYALAVEFLWFGCMKFTAYEAIGNAPLIAHSPILGWMNTVFGIQGASYMIGAIELTTSAMLLLGSMVPVVSALGAAMSTTTFVVTLTFFASTPGVAEPSAGGFPAISALPGQFLLKDLVLLAASVTLLRASLNLNRKTLAGGDFTMQS